MNGSTQRKSTFEDGSRYFKASRADHGTKVAILKNNLDKYSLSTMCDVLQIARIIFYYEEKEPVLEDERSQVNVDNFHMNRKAYGTRKIKCKLKERGLIVSRRRTGSEVRTSVETYGKHSKSNWWNRLFEKIGTKYKDF